MKQLGRVQATVAQKVHIKPPLMRRLSVWLLVMGVLMALTEAVISNAQVSNGARLAALQLEQGQLTLDKDDVERQIFSAGSLATIRQQAVDKMGMEPVGKRLIYLDYFAK